MAINVPIQVAAASGWVLNDYLTMQRRSAPAAGGLCTVTFDQLDPNERWLIDHAVITTTSSTATVLRLYEGTIDPLSLLDGSGSGGFDVADWPNGLAVAPTQALIAVWTGASTGSTGTVTLQARVLRRT
jgi:hypothetical protein